MKPFVMGLLLLVSMHSFAGPRIVGNGGVGVNLNGHLYMLDLYERGIQESAYYAPDIQVPKWVSEELAKLFGMTNLQNVPLEKLSMKVTELLQKRYRSGMLLQTALVNLDWRLLDAELEPLEDTKTPLIGLTLEQVAIRQDNVVFINAKLWNQLDADNKVALLIHEAFYFAGTPEVIDNGKTSYYQQNASQARSITGLLFTKRFAKEGLTESNSTFRPYLSDSDPSPFRARRHAYVTSVSFSIILPYDFPDASPYAGVMPSSQDFALGEFKSKSEMSAAVDAWTLQACKKGLVGGAKDKYPKWNLTTQFGIYDFNFKLDKHVRQSGEQQSHLASKPKFSAIQDFEKGFDWSSYKTPKQCADALKVLVNKQMDKHANYKD